MRRVLVALLFMWSIGCWAKDSTTFAPGFKEEAFRRVTVGMSKQEVLALLGPPLVTVPSVTGQIWRFGPSGEQAGVEGGAPISSTGVFFDAQGSVLRVYDVAGVSIGMSSSEVKAITGEPVAVTELKSATFLHYSKPGESGMFRQRTIGLDADDVVVDIISIASWE
jgi:hypothetical protein